MNYVSLLNTGFSGSTLVSMMLSSQSGVVGFGDTYFSANPKHFPKHPCTCGEWYDECKPRIASRNAIHAGGIVDFEWPTTTAVPLPAWIPNQFRKYWPLTKSASLPFVSAVPHSIRKTMFARFYRRNQLMIDGLESTGNYHTYVDGCKDLVRFELLQSAIENIRVLHIVRHPGAYLYHFHKAGDCQYELRLGHWARYNKLSRQLSQQVPSERYFPITYESIVRDPKSFLSDFAAFIETSDFDLAEPRKLIRSRVHVIGNRMREDANEVLDFSNTWRDKLPAEVEQQVDRMVAEDEWLATLYN